MIRVSKLIIFVVGLLVGPLIFAQQDPQPQHMATVATAAEKAKPAAPKVEAPAASKPTPQPLTEDQQLGRQILESSEAMARGLESPMRSYSLLQIAQAYLPTDKAKAASLLRDAFMASVSIPDDRDKQDTKNRLQESILRALLPISQPDVEERLPQASPGVRKTLSTAIINLYANKKQFEPAIELINRLTAEDEFPYGSGIALMNAMPPEMSGEKQELFAQATSSYDQHSKHGMRFGGGFTDLVVRFGASMPPKLALEAIDEILKQAKDANEPCSLTLSSDAGTASFDSSYEYALFAMLPLLKQLDESRAKSLIEENQDLQSKLQQFPQGVQSLNPDLGNSPPKSDDSTKNADSSKKGEPPKHRGMGVEMHSGKVSPEQSAETYRRAELQRNLQQIIDSSENDPVQAIAQAATLPASMAGPLPQSPRGRVLEAIAKANVKDHPAIAKQAVDELRKTAEELTGQGQAVYLASAADLYLQLGDGDTAEKIVSEGFKAAEKMMEQDNDADDPNTALKAWWPSTDAYRRFIEIETKISHRSTANILKEIKDSDIRTVESIMVARTLLGVPMGQYTIMKQPKNGKNGFTMVSSGP